MSKRLRSRAILPNRPERGTKLRRCTIEYSYSEYLLKHSRSICISTDQKVLLALGSHTDQTLHHAPNWRFLGIKKTRRSGSLRFVFVSAYRCNTARLQKSAAAQHLRQIAVVQSFAGSYLTNLKRPGFDLRHPAHILHCSPLYSLGPCGPLALLRSWTSFTSTPVQNFAKSFLSHGCIQKSYIELLRISATLSPLITCSVSLQEPHPRKNSVPTSCKRNRPSATPLKFFWLQYQVRLLPPQWQH